MDNLFVFKGALDASQVRTINSQGLAGIQSVAGLPNGNTVSEPSSLLLAALAAVALGLSRRKTSTAR
jgi:hypothetical protein